MFKIDFDWMSEYIGNIPSNIKAPKSSSDLDLDKVADDFVRVGVEKEKIIEPEVSGPIVVGKVISFTSDKQSNGKVINWCQIDTGDDSPRGIICGAHNFKENDLVVVALPGAVLPGGFEISARKTYGHISEGMMCSSRELNLGQDHDGIIILSNFGLSDKELASLKPGQDAKPLLGLDKKVLDVNITPDRGYCFSYRGIAREYAHALNGKDRKPKAKKVEYIDPVVELDKKANKLLEENSDSAAKSSKFEVVLDDKKPLDGNLGCTVFTTRIVKGVDPKAQTPIWMRRRLNAVGVRPISLIVDVTNYVMFALGQPLHAYDLNKLHAPIVVRRANKNETLRTLDGVDRNLNEKDLLITDSVKSKGDHAIGLAGVMGGEDTEITPGQTSDVLIESAYFEPGTICQTARRYNLSSDAAFRFERNIDCKMQLAAAQLAADLLVEYGGGQDLTESISKVSIQKDKEPLEFNQSEIKRLLGVDIDKEYVDSLLEEVCIKILSYKDGKYLLEIPAWRPDIQIQADVVEEIARLYGYDKIDSALPRVTYSDNSLTDLEKLRRRIVDYLASISMVETLSYPFVDPKTFEEYQISVTDSVKLANPIDEQKMLLRTNILQTLLKTFELNLKRGNEFCSIFESGTVYLPTKDTNKVSGVKDIPVAKRPSEAQIEQINKLLPEQPTHIAGVFSGPIEKHRWNLQVNNHSWISSFNAVKTILDNFVSVDYELVRVDETEDQIWHPTRSAKIVSGKEVLGYVGELHPEVVKKISAHKHTAIFEIYLDKIVACADGLFKKEVPISTFPIAKEDFSFVVGEDVEAKIVEDAIVEAAREYIEDISLFDVFNVSDKGKKSLTFSLTFRSKSETLSSEKLHEIREKILEFTKKVGAELRDF